MRTLKAPEIYLRAVSCSSEKQINFHNKRDVICRLRRKSGKENLIEFPAFCPSEAFDPIREIKDVECCASLSLIIF